MTLSIINDIIIGIYLSIFHIVNNFIYHDDNYIFISLKIFKS